MLSGPRSGRGRRGFGRGYKADEASYAALDLGTNNCRLLIATPARGGFRVVDAFSRIVRLGEGLAASGELSAPAMDRTLEALKVCASKLRRKQVRATRAVATEACRRARNCEGFLDRVRKETGIELEIISTSEEASLAITGCAPLLDPSTPKALIFDIGGGSTEVSYVDCEPGPAARPWAGPRVTLKGLASIPIGVMTLTEQFGACGDPGKSYDAMIAEMKFALTSFEAQHQISAFSTARTLQMLGTSGTVTTLAGIEQGLTRYNRARVDGTFLSREAILTTSRRLAGMSFDERAKEGCIGQERADLVVAGCAILEALCEMWPVANLRVADRGLREGILYSLMGGEGEHGTVPRPRVMVTREDV